jgi:hypothetical protein
MSKMLVTYGPTPPLYYLVIYAPADSPAVARLVADYNWLQVWGSRGEAQRFGAALCRMLGELRRLDAAS